MIKNPKLSECYFYLNLNIWGDFQICISVTLNAINCFCKNLHRICLIGASIRQKYLTSNSESLRETMNTF